MLWPSIPSGFLAVFEKPNRSSFTFSFTYRQNGTFSTAPNVSVSTLALGSHNISLEVRDANGMVARAATTVSIGNAGGVPCTTGDTCLSGYCTG